MNIRTAFLAAFITMVIPFTTAAATTQWSANVDVPDHCTVADSDGVSHDYSGQYLGICALESAITNGSVSGAVFSNAYPSLGLFVTAIEGIAADPSSQYWALYQNGGYASNGLSQLPVASGDTLVLELHDFSDTYLGDRLTLTIRSLVSATPTAAPSSGGLTLHDPFNVAKALSFIWTGQGANGSFGSSLMDDWVAIATAGGGAGDMQARLTAYYFAHPPVLTNVTDFERHSMALEALGISPYLGPSDYITPIVRAFDGTQIGDSSQDNDDIFAVFPLMHAGYTQDDAIIASTTAFILSRQHADGSWDDSADMTAAALQALALTPSLPGVHEASAKALVYLHKAQKSDGGFGDPSATSWVLQAAEALGQSPFDWDAGTYQMPDYYLATQQEFDGGEGPMKDDMQKRLWETAYAIPAIEHKSWDMLLSQFPKPAPSMFAASTTTETTATSTPGEQSTSTQKTIAIAAVSNAAPHPTEVRPWQSPKERAEAATATPARSTPTSTVQTAGAAAAQPSSWAHEMLSILFPWFF